MNIYLDIDGVLVTDSLDDYGKPTRHAIELLRYLTEKHHCFWLTTHCHGGESHVERYLSGIFPPEAMQYIKMIRPLDWTTWKTEAIDFTQDFRWLDDDVYEEERRALEDHGCMDKLILLNLQVNPEQLKEVMNKI